MKSLIQILLIPALLGLHSANAKANGPEQEFARTLNREFATTADGMTALYNKYGKVNVNTWNENKVKIDITITVHASDQRDADRTFDKIKVNFTNTAGYVKAETVILEASSGTSFWTSMTKGFDKGNDFKINYEVWMPIGNQLDLKNRYGNAYVSNLNGKLFAEMKYGDLRTETVNNDADLYIGYGKASLNKVNNLSGQVSYGGLLLTQVQDVQLDSKYSEVQIQQAGNMRVTSKYDKFQLGTVKDLRLQTKYADVHIDDAQAAYLTAQYTDVLIQELHGSADADLTYGSLVVENVGRGFTNINIVGKYTDVKLLVDRSAAFRFNVEGEHTDLKVPSYAVIKRHNESATFSNMEGYIGDPNTRNAVKAKLSYGDFVLK